MIPSARARPVLAALLCVLIVACVPRIQDPGPRPTGGAKAGEGALIARDGADLPVRTWSAPAPRAIVVALHGMNDYSNAFDAPASWWAAEADLTTYAIDQRGFGETGQRGLWPGADRMIADAADAVQYARARHPGLPVVLLGLSMGGAVALSAVAEGAVAPDGLILAAPAVWGWSTLPFTYRAALWLTAHTIPWKRFSGGGVAVTPSDNIPMLRALGRDPLVIKETRTDAIYGLVTLMDRAYRSAGALEGPVLMVFGGQDEIVPAGPSRAVADHLCRTGKTVLHYEDSYHMILRDLEAQRVWSDIALWIDTLRERPLSAFVGEGLCGGDGKDDLTLPR